MIMVSQEQLKALKAKGRLLEPMVRIGKNGLTDSALRQVQLLLNKRKLVKVKLLKSFMESNERKVSAEELALRTGAELIDQVGFVVVLYKR